MSIDPKTEPVFPLSEANAHSPGKPVSRQAWMRRAFKGIRNRNGEIVVLATILLGRERYTNQSSIDEFFRRQNESSSGSVSLSQQGERAAAASRELAKVLG